MCSTLQLLGRTTLALLLVVALPQSARANFIDLVSQSYRIHALGMAVPPATQVVVDYDETSDMPISRQDSPFIFVPGCCKAGLLFLDTSADGGMTPASAFVQADSSKTASGSAAAQIAEATAAITFRPLVTDLVVQTVNEIPSPVLPGCCIKWRNGISGLYDVTAGAAVLAFEGLITPAEYIVSLNLEHLYTIYASAPNAAGESPEFGARLNIFPAPESESTLTFFVLGLGALLIARSQTFRPSRPISDT